MLLAQNDSLDKNTSSITSFFYESEFLNENAYQLIQPNSIQSQNYLPRNTLGNVGLAINSLSYLPGFDAIGFNYGRNAYQPYFFKQQNLKYYTTRSPYTDLLYVMGSKKEQVFNGVFAYNIKPNWNVSAYFNRIRAEGFYLRQNTNQSYIALSSNFKSLNNRYALLFSGMYNDAKNAENGGIKYDTAFEEGGLIDKKILEINLKQAKRRVVNRSVFLKQYLNLGKHINDTSSQIIPAWQFALASGYEDNDWRYTDANPVSGFYSFIYLDSTGTNDKLANSKLENTISFSRTDNTKHRGFIDWIGFSLSATHQLLTVKQNSLDSTFANLIAGAKLYNTYNTNGFAFEISGKYVLNGFNSGDYTGMLALQKKINKNFKIYLSGGAENRTPDFIYSFYSSNNFYWKNNFKKTTQQYAEFGLISEKHRLQVLTNYSIYGNIPYFDKYALASQFNGDISVFTTRLKKNFKVYNWHLDNDVVYNYIPDSAVIRLPQFVLNHSLYYESNAFKNAMRLQIGFALFYTTAYYANAYMPATAQFYVQDNKKYGNYPFLDFFINMKIKMVNAFIKVEHFNSGLMGNTYMQTPFYPTNDRAFKIGVSWKFFD